MKTIFITAAEPGAFDAVSKTSAFEMLLTNSAMRVVLITSPNLVGVYTDSGLVTESVTPVIPSVFEKILAFCARNGFPSGTNQIMQHRAYSNGESRIPVWVKGIVATVFGAVKPLRSVVRSLDLGIASQSEVIRLFDTYKPDLVFSTVSIRETLDVPILREAKRRGIRTLGMVRSWDNLTTSGFVRIIPNHFFAQNDFLRDMAVTLHDIPAQSITVVGTPAFDKYKQAELLVPREIHCAQLGIDPNKKIILYAAIGDFLFPKESEIADVFERLIDENKLDGDCVFVFRPHPAFESTIGHIGNMQHVIGDTATKQDKVTRGSMNKGDAAHLVNSIFHASVVVTAGSTVMIEAALLDKPVITILFDGLSKVSYWFSIARFHDRAIHIVNLLKTGAVRIARNQDELALEIEDSLAHPEKNDLDRLALVERFAGPNLGHAGESVVEALLAEVERVG